MATGCGETVLRTECDRVRAAIVLRLFPWRVTTCVRGLRGRFFSFSVKLSVTDGAQWLSLQTELHTRPVSFLVSGEALETNSRAAPLSTFRLSRARFELLVSKYR